MKGGSFLLTFRRSPFEQSPYISASWNNHNSSCWKSVAAALELKSPAPALARSVPEGEMSIQRHKMSRTTLMDQIPKAAVLFPSGSLSACACQTRRGWSRNELYPRLSHLLYTRSACAAGRAETRPRPRVSRRLGPNPAVRWAPRWPSTCRGGVSSLGYKEVVFPYPAAPTPPPEPRARGPARPGGSLQLMVLLVVVVWWRSGA